jgi:hypothetical protein
LRASKSHRLFNRISGTPEGPAGHRTAAINIDFTLLFAIERYDAAAAAYPRALERRAAVSASIHHVAFFASFFPAVDELLLAKRKSGDPDVERLLGKRAVANAKLAYQGFKEMVSSTRWHSLERAGARLQQLPSRTAEGRRHHWNGAR